MVGNSRHDPFYRTETSRMTANLTKHALMDLASTMSDGKEFQTLATLLEKKFQLPVGITSSTYQFFTTTSGYI